MTATTISITTLNSDNAAIARGLKSQDPDVLNHLIELHQHRVMRYLLHLTGRRDQAEDLFQELWLRVLRSGSSYNGTSAFDNWLFAIARNLFLDLKRRRPVASLDEMSSPEDGGAGFEVMDGKPSPLQQFQEREDMEGINTALLALDASQREVLTLRYDGELSLDEIARVTHVPLSTVKSRLYRGVTALKTRMESLR
jgi:RNA polymerase sigma-70 factor (ECF subfamily)